MILTNNSSATPTLGQIIVSQTPISNGFICPRCRSYKGGLACKKNFFISMVGANMSGCSGYEIERRKSRVGNQNEV